MSFQASCRHLTVFDILMHFAQHWGKTATPFLKPVALSGLSRTYKTRDHQEQRKYIRCQWRQNSDGDLLAFFSQFEFHSVISCSQFYSLFFLFLSSVVFETPSKSGHFQPISVLLTALISKSIWIIAISFLFKKGYAWPTSLQFLGQKSSQLPMGFSYCLLFVFKISQKRKIIFCRGHLGTIDRVNETNRNLRYI